MNDVMLNPLLLLVWVLWAGLLFGGLIVGVPNSDQSARMPRWMRLTSSLMLVVAAWVITAQQWETPHADLVALTALGMTLGFIGDLFMAKLIVRSDMSVLGGMSAFGLGHVVYSLMMITVAARFGLDAAAPRGLALGLVLIIGAVCWYVVVLRGAAKPSLLHGVALPYALLLSTTAGLTGGLALQQPRFIPAAIGGLLFLTSDLILAAQLFNQAYFRWIGDWVWLTYGPAQMLIVYGMGWALSGLLTQ